MIDSKKQMDRIVRDSYPNLIIDKILDAIKKGQLKPGDVLPSENELVKLFHVGRTTLREALAGLEYMNIIVLENGKNFINRDVRSFYSRKLLYHHKIDKKQREDLLEVRRILETEFAMLAAQRATVNDIKRLRQILRAMSFSLSEMKEQASRLNNDITQVYTDLSIQFHMALAKATQNSMYVRIYERLKDMMFSTEIRLDLDYMTASYKCYEKILKSIEDRDHQKAVTNLKEYIAVVRKQLLALEE